MSIIRLVGQSAKQPTSKRECSTITLSLVALLRGEKAVEHIDAFLGEVKQVKGGNSRRSYPASLNILYVSPPTTHTRTHLIHTHTYIYIHASPSAARLTYLAIYQSTHQPATQTYNFQAA